jgi:choice-of-anchor A domain-containing protein
MGSGSLFALCLVVAGIPLAARAQHEQSLDAYVPSTHKTVFQSYNLMVLGNLNIAKSSVQGRVAVGGDAAVTEFDFNGDGDCDPYTRAVIVSGKLFAAMGRISNGFVAVGRGTKIQHNVDMPCSSHVERYDPVKLKMRTFDEFRTGLIRETSGVCHNPVSGAVEVDKETMRFVPGNTTYSCYAVFKVKVANLVTIKRFEFLGTNKNQNVIILIVGRNAVLRDLAMVNFAARRTLLAICSMYGGVEVFNGRLQGSILAPITDLTVMGTVVNGSVVTGSLRGNVALRNQPYEAC